MASWFRRAPKDPASPKVRRQWTWPRVGRSHVASSVQIAGILAIADGVWRILPAAGVITAGLGALLWGIALERG